MIVPSVGTPAVCALFEGWQDTMVWSCLDGTMGHLYVTPDADNPQSAMAILGSFCFFAGIPDRALVSYKPDWCGQDFIMMIAEDPAWYPIIASVYGDRAQRYTRYAIKKEPDVFDRKRLQVFVSGLDPKYRLCMIDETLYYRCQREGWTRDFVEQFPTWEQYRDLGIGVVVMHGDEIVAGASSYTRYRDGIEIEIDTREDYRCQGLATVCGAALILACLDRGLYPSWDAHTEISVALAEKLGYHRDHPYVTYIINGY